MTSCTTIHLDWNKCRRLIKKVATCQSSQVLSVAHISLCFKSKVQSSEHDHIVLAIYNGLHWGAIGISRLQNLMYKSFQYTSLHHLVQESIKCYKEYRHEVIMISIGLPFSHDSSSETPIQWKVLNINLRDCSSDQVAVQLDRFTRDCSFIFDFFSRTCRYPDFCSKEYCNRKS
jgi:hypothetical protein